MNYVANWNRFDSFLFFCENKISRAKAVISNSREEEPDVELMIQAETEHLRIENENLKKRETPVYLNEEEGRYFCPKCQMEIMNANAKYCPNCGHRVMKPVSSQNPGRIESAD